LSSPAVDPPSAAEADTYAAAAAALTQGDARALARMTGLAQGGDTQAQRHLASLYEAGAAGLPRDLAAARSWTERAAHAGDRLAMHNLALFLADGEGGTRDPAEAAAWFRRAAERGVVDSQYNLGLVFEAGRGVAQNLREAYRWFAVAANAGDLAARERQVALEQRLAPAERAVLDREAAAFRPGLADSAPTLIIPPATTLAETQALLARQGYYVGPIDGLTSVTLRAAAQAYLRDHPAGGASGVASAGRD
jgi:localization factor PodJL